MKLTWFGGTVLRIYVGGSILVLDAELAPEGISRAELVAGADRVLALAGDAAEAIDAMKWRPRRVAALVDEGAAMPAVEAHRIGGAAWLIDAVGEPPLVLIKGDAPQFGRWADGAVVLLFGAGEGASAVGEALLNAARPKLIALADSDEAVDKAVDLLRGQLEGAGLIALEKGLAVEV